MYRAIGRYRRPVHTKSLTSLNMTRHLLYAYFRLRTAIIVCAKNEGLEFEEIWCG